MNNSFQCQPQYQDKLKDSASQTRIIPLKSTINGTMLAFLSVSFVLFKSFCISFIA